MSERFDRIRQLALDNAYGNPLNSTTILPVNSLNEEGVDKPEMVSDADYNIARPDEDLADGTVKSELVGEADYNITRPNVDSTSKREFNRGLFGLGPKPDYEWVDETIKLPDRYDPDYINSEHSWRIDWTKSLTAMASQFQRAYGVDLTSFKLPSDGGAAEWINWSSNILTQGSNLLNGIDPQILNSSWGRMLTKANSLANFTSNIFARAGQSVSKGTDYGGLITNLLISAGMDATNALLMMQMIKKMNKAYSNIAPDTTHDGDEHCKFEFDWDDSTRHLYTNGLAKWLTVNTTCEAFHIAYEIMTGDHSKSTKQNFRRYFNLVDPFDEFNSLNIDNYDTKDEFFDALKEFKSGDDKFNLLPNYEIYRNFEIGTNHQWYIRMKPYDPKPFVEGRYTCVPELPKIPLWSDGINLNLPPNKNSDLESSFWKSSQLAQMVTSNIEDIKSLFNNSNNEDTDGSAIPEQLLSCKWLDYSDNPPILSYDLTFGTIKTDSLKTFNGSSEIFNGMNYNIMMNMSILDDADATFYKYMNSYINHIYDISTNSMAPYWASLMEIDLYILRSGGNIKHSFRLIGIPIEFSPRFEGSQEPNECRVDLSWGIIGMINPKSNGITTYSSRDKESPDKAGKSGFTWNDITLDINPKPKK